MECCEDVHTAGRKCLIVIDYQSEQSQQKINTKDYTPEVRKQMVQIVVKSALRSDERSNLNKYL